MAGRLEKAIKARGLSYRAAAKEAGIHFPSLHRAVQPDSESSVDLILKVADSLDLSLEWLVRGVGPMERTPTSPAEVEAMAAGEARAVEVLLKAMEVAATDAGLGVIPAISQHAAELARIAQVGHAVDSGHVPLDDPKKPEKPDEEPRRRRGRG